MYLDRYDLVIDGYNLMHASGQARQRYGPGDLERCRNRFLRWVAKRVPEKRRGRTIVVFDAGETSNQYIELGSFESMRLLYSPQGLEADDLIEDLIASHTAPKRLQVISSDHRLHKAARRRKATCIDSELFVSTLARAARAQREAERQRREESKPTGELPEEMAEWMRVFADVQGLAQEGRLREADDRMETTEQPRRTTNEPNIETPPGGNEEAVEMVTGLAGEELAFWEARVRELMEQPQPERKGSRGRPPRGR